MITLGARERELKRVRKHWFFFFWPVIFTIFSQGLLLPWLIYRILVYFTDEFIITDQKIHFSRGIISKKAESIPTDKINEVHYNQSVFGRLVGYGTVYIQSGAMSAGNGFTFIPNPGQVKGIIESAVENRQDNRDRRLAGYIGDAVRR